MSHRRQPFASLTTCPECTLAQCSGRCGPLESRSTNAYVHSRRCPVGVCWSQAHGSACNWRPCMRCSCTMTARTRSTSKSSTYQAAAIALHARSVILISRPALGLLSRAELQATVAHELGHDYFWSAYWLAKQQADPIALQVLELKCDGIAALTLDALGVDPRYLSDAIAKIGKFNEVPSFRWGQNGYPHPRDRERFVKELLLSMRMKGR